MASADMRQLLGHRFPRTASPRTRRPARRRSAVNGQGRYSSLLDAHVDAPPRDAVLMNVAVEIHRALGNLLEGNVGEHQRGNAPDGQRQVCVVERVGDDTAPAVLVVVPEHQDLPPGKLRHPLEPPAIENRHGDCHPGPTPCRPRRPLGAKPRAAPRPISGTLSNGLPKDPRAIQSPRWRSLQTKTRPSSGSSRSPAGKTTEACSIERVPPGSRPGFHGGTRPGRVDDWRGGGRRMGVAVPGGFRPWPVPHSPPWLRFQSRLACSAGDSPAGARIRSPVAWIAGRRETKFLKPIDRVSLGEIASHRAVT